MFTSILNFQILDAPHVNSVHNVRELDLSYTPT